MVREILLVPRARIHFTPTSGIYVPFNGTVPDVLKTPHVRSEKGPLRGFESGWRSGLVKVKREWFKLKGSRPSPGVHGDNNNPNGTQRRSFAEHELEKTFQRKEMFEREGFVYPLDPRGLWVYDQEFDGEKVAASIFEIQGDTRFDELLWWLEKGPLNFISPAERIQLMHLVSMVALTSGQMLRILHNNNHTWDHENERASNAHTGNVIIFPGKKTGDTKAAIADFDNSLDFHQEEKDPVLLDMQRRIQTRDIRTFADDLLGHRVVSIAEGETWDPVAITKSHIGRAVIKHFGSVSEDDELALQEYFNFQMRPRNPWGREFLTTSFERGYSDTPTRTNLVVPWDVDRVREAATRFAGQLDETFEEFLSRPKEEILEAAREFSFILNYPVQVITPNGKIRNNYEPQLGKKHADSLDTRIDVVALATLLEHEESQLQKKPGAGFAEFPRMTEATYNRFKDFSYGDLIHIAAWWIGGTLKRELSERFSPKAIGAFILGIAQTHPLELLQAVTQALPYPYQDDFIERMVRTDELLELIPPQMQKESGLADHIHSLKATRQLQEAVERKEFEDEIRRRTALSLLKYGIATKTFASIMTSSNMDITLTQFDGDHVKALREEYKKNRDIEGNRYSETQRIINIALTGIAVREGKPPFHYLTGHESDPVVIPYLAYFYADRSTKDIPVPDYVQKSLHKEMSSEATTSLAMDFIKTGGSLHSDSLLATALRTTTPTLEVGVILMKTLLDETRGDVSKADPVLLSILNEKIYGGAITSDMASQLTMSCVAFGIDLPECIKRSITEENARIFAGALTLEKVDRGYNIWGREYSPYPVHPVHAILTRGLAALPPIVREIIEARKDDDDLTNEWALQIIRHLSQEGFYFQYFGASFRKDGYPPPAVAPKELWDKASKKMHLWKLVHPDIWEFVAKADPETVKRAIHSRIPSGQIQIHMRQAGSSVVAIDDCTLDELFPPQIAKNLI